MQPNSLIQKPAHGLNSTVNIVCVTNLIWQIVREKASVQWRPCSKIWNFSSPDILHIPLCSMETSGVVTPVVIQMEDLLFLILPAIMGIVKLILPSPTCLADLLHHFMTHLFPSALPKHVPSVLSPPALHLSSSHHPVLEALRAQTEARIAATRGIRVL